MYSKVKLVPNYSTTIHRADNDTSCNFLGYEFKLPIIPANMESVIDIPLALKLAEKGYFYILHRFMDYQSIFRFVELCKTKQVISSISIGVKEVDYDLIKSLKNLAPDFITVDIAHGHSLLMKNMLGYLKKKLPKTKVIAGNVGTRKAMTDLMLWGADACKGGLSIGGACRTYNQTGFLVHPLDIDIKNLSIPLVADGGIKNIGDMVKALVFGYDMVMVGSLLAGFEESPGKVIEIDDKFYKNYSGSTANNEKYREGASKHIKLKGSIWEYLAVVEEGFQSAISYAGGNNLEVFKNTKWSIK